MHDPYKLTLSDIEEWVKNDYDLYHWWLREKGRLRDFAREHRATLEKYIHERLNRKPIR